MEKGVKCAAAFGILGHEENWGGKGIVSVPFMPGCVWGRGRVFVRGGRNAIF